MNHYYPGLVASSVVACCALLFSIKAGAIEPITENKGWSGYVLFGGGFTDVKSNTVVGNDIVDVGDDTISSIFQNPESDDVVHPIFGLELRLLYLW